MRRAHTAPAAQGPVSHAAEQTPRANAGAHPLPGAHRQVEAVTALVVDVARRARGERLDHDAQRRARDDGADVVRAAR